MSKAPLVNLSGMDDLFGIPEGHTEIMEISIADLVTFKDHPFQVRDDDDMKALVESVNLHQKILEPILVRANGLGKFEIISGHRRTEAAKQCNFEKIPAIISELTDDEAVVIMVDSNLKRENLLYSERALAYRMKYDAMKHQGKLGEGRSLEALADESNESVKKIQRLIKLSHLNISLLELVDKGNIPFLAGVDLANLNDKEQRIFYSVLISTVNMKIDGKAASQVKELHNKNNITVQSIRNILIPNKPVSCKKSFTWKSEKIYNYFPKDTKNSEIEEVILNLLEKYKDEL